LWVHVDAIVSACDMDILSLLIRSLLFI
jgi:hypothetical protein